ncbi:putative ABC1 domain-containing protein [Rosellinia necatrix]|uniref:Protein YAE1 n=1 Tax=Rosellinia necatrix TaxID=77044 RepID=A0A1W2TAG9_ROSNE|nr:putative ABC1 domain-containing protein [Rosellinia necatrix]
MHLAQPPGSFGDDDLDYHTSIFQMNPAGAPAIYDPLDDIFGPDPASPGPGPGISAAHDDGGRSGSPDMSLDTRRLRTQHNTVGYRDGITVGKAGSIQAGFDQGFALGANIGIRAGQVLGLLEGIAAALAEAGQADEAARADSLLAQAAAELSPESVFTPAFWAPDGTWTYPVTASHDGGEVVYPDVAGQHPLVAKWNRIARLAADKCNIDQGVAILESDEPGTDDDVAIPGLVSKPDTTLRDAIAW